MVCVVKPVVRSHEILLAVIVDKTAENRIRIEFSVRSDECLSLRNIVYLIAYTTVATVGKESLVRHEMSILRSVAAVLIIVAECSIVNLVILTWLSDVVITLERLCVETPLHVHIHHCITDLCLLCCDHDDTVRSTGTVKSI